MEMRYYLSMFLTVFILSSTEASKAAGKVKIKSRSPVYFPVIPIINFDDDFGSRVAESISHSRRVPSTSVDNSLPISVYKITTTTEKLPLAQESHVASNSITEAPGPAYLTDSLYYIGDHTPDPFEDKDYDNGYYNVLNLQSSNEDRERESEVLGVYLQSISSYQPPLFSKSRDKFDSLINPAKMHYIPPNSGELEEENNVAKIDAPPSSYIHLSDNISSESLEYNPPSHSISLYDIPKNAAPDVTETKLTNSKLPLASSNRYPEVLPETYRSPTLETNVPMIIYESPTRAPPVIRIKPASSKRVVNPVNMLPDRTLSSSSSQSLFVKSSDLIMSKPAVSSQTSSVSFLRSPSSRYLPKPASNPFAARISQPVVKPVYESEDKMDFFNFPANQKHSSLTEFSLPKAETEYHTQLTDVSPRKPHSSANENTRRKNFGERKQKIIKTVEIYRPPTSSEDQNILFESRKRDYGFGFNRASGSAPRQQYKYPSVTLTPLSEAPVYRTSTKSYRAPSSLFQIKETIGKPVTAPSQPEFIQTDPNIYVPQEYDENAIPGIGGVDYPNFASIPKTEFKCSIQEHPGLYADQSTKCQVFHICQEGGREDSFLCPNGTVFNQQYFVCDWWYNFSCESADRFYSLNALIYELPDSTKYYT